MKALSDLPLPPLLSYPAQAAYAQHLSDLRDGFFASVGLLTVGLPETGGALSEEVRGALAGVSKSRLKAQASWTIPAAAHAAHGEKGELNALVDLSSPRVLSLSVVAPRHLLSRPGGSPRNSLALTLSAELSRFADDLSSPSFQGFAAPVPEEGSEAHQVIEQRMQLRLRWAEDEAQFESGVRAAASFLMLLAKYSCGKLEVLM